jgi:hypothetical protein
MRRYSAKPVTLPWCGAGSAARLASYGGYRLHYVALYFKHGIYFSVVLFELRTTRVFGIPAMPSSGHEGSICVSMGGRAFILRLVIEW